MWVISEQNTQPRRSYALRWIGEGLEFGETSNGGVDSGLVRTVDMVVDVVVKAGSGDGEEMGHSVGDAKGASCTYAGGGYDSDIGRLRSCKLHS